MDDKEEIEITTDDQNLIGIPVPYKNELYLIIYCASTKTYSFISYNMIDSFHRASQKLNPENAISFDDAAASRIFLFNNKISVFTAGRYNKINRTWRSTLYCLNTEALHATWTPVVPYCSFTATKFEFDFDNYVSISHKDNEIIVVTGVNNCITFRAFIKSAYGSKWEWATTNVTLSNISANFKILSCTMIMSDIYCLLQQGVNFYVCKFNIKITQRQKIYKVYARLAFTWHIKDDPTLERHHFISVYNEEIVIISSHVIDNTGIFEVRQPELNSKNLAVQHRFEIPQVMTTVSALVVPCTERLVIAVIYHNSKNNKFYIKNSMMPHASVQCTSSDDSESEDQATN